jgi:hypothetical protein
LHGDAADSGDQSGGRDGDVASHEDRKAASRLREEEEEAAVVVVVEVVRRRKRLSKMGRKRRIGLAVAGSNGGSSIKNCDVIAVV